MRLILVALFLATSSVSGRSHGHSTHGGSHHYPASTGHSGYGSGGTHSSGYGSGGTHSSSSGYGSGGTHSYPASTGMSGNTYNGNTRPTHHQQPNVAHNSYSSRTEVHHHYHYSPPQQISYGSTYHPVYQGHPPVYVYEYRDSGSRFDTLLTGLALYNLGRNSHSHHYNSDRQYTSSPGEICKLHISKGPGNYEETRIDCNLMSSFIWDDTTSSTQNQQHVKNTTQVTVTQTVNGAGNSSVSTVTTTSNTVEDALKVKGPSIQVTPGMTCSMIRISGGTITTRKPVDCGLLQEYARSSLQRSVAQCLTPLKTLVFNFLILYLVRY